ncbi:hypothetical protein [Leifsonia sp. NPDC058248]
MHGGSGCTAAPDARRLRMHGGAEFTRDKCHPASLTDALSTTPAVAAR